MVGVEHYRREILACWCRNNDLLSSSLEMSRSFFLGGVEARALENDINIMLFPRDVLCILLSIDLDGLSVDRYAVLACRNGIS